MARTHRKTPDTALQTGLVPTPETVYFEAVGEEALVAAGALVGGLVFHLDVCLGFSVYPQFPFL